jgi:hypothetical protein
MKRSPSKLLQTQTKSLFKFKNSGTRTKKFTGDGAATTVVDPTFVTSTLVTW